MNYQWSKKNFSNNFNDEKRIELSRYPHERGPTAYHTSLIHLTISLTNDAIFGQKNRLNFFCLKDAPSAKEFKTKPGICHMYSERRLVCELYVISWILWEKTSAAGFHLH